MDPWLKFIAKKTMSHFGFFLEGITEAIPMSIIQIIAIVVYREAAVVNVISIMLSMVSMGTKAIIGSYSPHRATSLFNFLCIFADIFKFFTVIAWVFRDVDDGYDFFLFSGLSFDLISLIWCWKVFLIGIQVFCFGVFVWSAALYDELRHNYGGSRCAMICPYLGLAILACMAYFPILIAFEMFFTGFAFFPLITIDKNRGLGPHGDFAGHLVSHITKGSASEKQEKVFWFNKVAENEWQNFPDKEDMWYKHYNYRRTQNPLTLMTFAKKPEDMPEYRPYFLVNPCKWYALGVKNVCQIQTEWSTTDCKNRIANFMAMIYVCFGTFNS
eukprot:UN25362